MTEERAAQILNTSMAVLLAALVLGASGWDVVDEFGHVRTIYQGLPAAQQDHLNAFVVSVSVLVMCIGFGVRFLNRWRGHPLVRPVLRMLKTWVPLAAIGGLYLSLGITMWSLVWLAGAAVVLASDLFEAWRARRRRRTPSPS